jgi:hypothetical protein
MRGKMAAERWVENKDAEGLTVAVGRADRKTELFQMRGLLIIDELGRFKSYLLVHFISPHRG